MMAYKVEQCVLYLREGIKRLDPIIVKGRLIMLQDDKRSDILFDSLEVIVDVEIGTTRADGSIVMVDIRDTNRKLVSKDGFMYKEDHIGKSYQAGLNTKSEITLLGDLDHPFHVGILDAYYNPSKLVIISSKRRANSFLTDEEELVTIEAGHIDFDYFTFKLDDRRGMFVAYVVYENRVVLYRVTN